MPTLFDEILADGLTVLQEVIGEDFAYRAAAGGSSRVVTGLVDRSGSFQDRDYGIEDQELAVVTVSRESTGIPSPAVGDSIVLSDDDRAYSWTGEREAGRPGLWRLVFSRPKLIRQGASQTMAR